MEPKNEKYIPVHRRKTCVNKQKWTKVKKKLTDTPKKLTDTPKKLTDTPKTIQTNLDDIFSKNSYNMLSHDTIPSYKDLVPSGTKWSDIEDP